MKNLIWGFVLALGMFCQTVAHAQTVSLGKPATLRAKSSSAQSYEWTFPGGIVINGEVVQFTFTEAGPQEVKLKVTDLTGNTNEIIKHILVANDSRPTAVIETLVNGKKVTGNMIEITLKDTISLKSESFAVDKTAADFSELWTVNGRTYTEDSLSAVFDKIGTYSVRLTVKDPSTANQQDQTSVQVKINNLPPVIQKIEIQPLGNSLEQFQVGVVAEDPDGSLSTFKFEVLEAGKTMLTQVAESDTTVFDLSRFPGAHTYNFRVTVSDDRFLSTTFTDNRTITVDPLNTNTPPEVTLQVLPGNQAYTGQAFDFKASATDADQDALKYEWLVSDGRRASTSAFQLVFSKAGKYSITLKVTDGLATTTEKLDLVVLEPEVLEVQNSAPEVEIYGILPSNKAPMNTMFRFYLQVTDADKDRLTYEWDFGNGAKSFTQNAAILYNLPGEYTVKVKVSDGIATVFDEVKVTVELGPREIYYKTAEDRLVDLQAERQRILDAIAANGGEITPAQRAQLQALNNNIADLIGEARSAGDFAAVTQLEQISQSLAVAAGNIEATVYDGMTLTELGEKLKEDQAEKIAALEAEAEILAEIDAQIKKAEADRVATVVNIVEQDNQALKTEITNLRSAMAIEKVTLEKQLKDLKAAGDVANAKITQDHLNVVNTQIETAVERTLKTQESLMTSRALLSQDKIDLEAELVKLKAAGDTENVILAQARLDVVNTQIETAIEQTLEVQKSLNDSWVVLTNEKTTLKSELVKLKLGGDTQNAALVQARLEAVNAQIDAAMEQTLVVQNSLNDSRAALEAEKIKLKGEIKALELAGELENAALAQARLETVNTQIETATEQTLEVQKSLEASRVALTKEKTDLKAELINLKAAGDAQNATLVQARLETVNAQINEAVERTLKTQESLMTSRALLSQDKIDLEAELVKLKAAGDTENVILAQARLDVVNTQIKTAIEQTLEVQKSLNDSRKNLAVEKADLNLQIAELKAGGDSENAARAEARLSEVNDQIETAIAQTITVQESLLASRSNLEAERETLLNTLSQAKQTGDTKNQTRAVTRLEEVNRAIFLANEQTLVIQQSLTDSRVSLGTEKITLEADIEAARLAGKTENQAAALARLEVVNMQIADANEATLKVQESLDESRLNLQSEKELLQISLEQVRTEENMANQARLEALMAVVDASLVEANQASVALQTEIEELRASLEAEQTAQLQALAEAKAQGSTENATRAQARLNEVNTQLTKAKTAQAETQKSIDSQRTELEQSKEDLYQQYAVAKASGDATNLARIQEQILATEKLLASLSSQSSEEYYAEQRAKYEARKTSVNLVISELEKAEKSGKSIDEFTAILKTQANTANPSSDQFKSAAVALEQQELIKRADFIQEQIKVLETLSANPTSLPPLGVDRKSKETLPDRLDRIENQANRAALEAQQRQNVAAQIAAVKQTEIIDQVRRLQQELQTEADVSRQTIISARIAVLEKEVADLEKLKNPGETLSNADIQKRVAELTAAIEVISDTVITEQQAFIATRLAELQVEIDLAADPRIKTDLEAQKKRLEANLNQTGILTDYEAQLKVSQKALNERLATNLNSTTQLLVQTQLNSVETKLDNLEKLKEGQTNLTNLQTTGANNPEVTAVKFLQTEKANLELELNEIKIQKARTSDVVERRALDQREAEIKKRLKDFPNTKMEVASLEALKVVTVVDYLKHFRSVEAQALSFGLEDEKPAQLALIDNQIKRLSRLNNFGYTPQTSLGTLLTDLERREGELLTLFREADKTKVEDLKQRLVVLADAMEQINGLEKYQIVKSDSVYRATEKLKGVMSVTSEAYLKAKTEADRIVVLQKLNEMKISERWLSRFYSPEKRNLTLGELENSLRADIKNGAKAQTVEDLVALQSIKANLDLAIKARVETDFENFKLNLQKQTAQVSDPDKKATIEARIKILKYDDLVSDVTLAKAQLLEALLADLTVKIDTNLFLYANVPLTQYEQPLLFEWDLGDGEKKFGQNISHEYYEAGFYRVVLTMSDGVTSQQDLFTIKVVE